MKILYGQKTVLMPFSECDVPKWCELLETEGDLMGKTQYPSFEAYLMDSLQKIMTGEWRVWTSWTKNLNQNKKIGFLVVYEISDKLKCSVLGVTDREITKGLIQKLKEDKITYAEDSLRACLGFLFNEMGMRRVGAYCLRSNKPPRKLLEKVGFKKEGELRNFAELKDELENVVIYGILKGE